MNTETSTLGTIVNIPETESVACNTLFEKYKSGFAPHAFVKLKTYDLVAAYTAKPGCGTNAAAEANWMILLFAEI